MLKGIDKEIGFMRTALNLRAYRQEVLASNIANADTPNYKAQDVDFSRELARMTGGGQGRLGMTRTATGHLAAKNTPPYDVDLKYRQPTQPSIDGNTVDMDVERSAFTENAIHYQFVADRISGTFSKMMTAIKGQ